MIRLFQAHASVRMKEKKLPFRFLLCVFFGMVTGLLSAQQLCTGSLGENIFEAGDFGSGTSNNIQVDPMIAPGYQYNSFGPPNDGYYTITNNTGGWSGIFGTWMKLRDNSPDPNGYMMVVNASYEPGIFYEQTIDGLCDNTLYEFSADVINVVMKGVPDHIMPQVDFLLDDVVQYSTGSIPQDETWKKYGFTFSLPPGQTSVKLTLRNNAPGGIGNDLALDNISFQPCGPRSFVETEELIFLCEEDNEAAKLTADIAIDESAIQWQISRDNGLNWEDIPGANDREYFHKDFRVGKYWYRYLGAGTPANLQNAKCRTISSEVILEVLPLRYEVQDTFCSGFSYKFAGRLLNQPGNYIDTFLSTKGCDSIVFLTLTELPDRPIEAEVNAIDPSCNGYTDGRVQIDVLAGGYGRLQYQLGARQNSTGFFEELPSGNFPLSIEDRYGCRYDASVNLLEPELFRLSLPPDTVVQLGSTLALNVEANYPIQSISWSPENFLLCTDCSNNQSTPGQNISYRVQASNSNGCADQGTITIGVNKTGLRIYVPSAFSPNGDGVNDFFGIGTLNNLIKSIDEFAVFDRWGNLMVQRFNVDASAAEMLWDGNSPNGEARGGIYVYYLKVTLLNDEERQLVGDISLIK